MYCKQTGPWNFETRQTLSRGQFALQFPNSWGTSPLSPWFTPMLQNSLLLYIICRKCPAIIPLRPALQNDLWPRTGSPNTDTLTKYDKTALIKRNSEYSAPLYPQSFDAEISIKTTRCNDIRAYHILHLSVNRKRIKRTLCQPTFFIGPPCGTVCHLVYRCYN